MNFNGAQIHLIVNHLPVVGFVGIVLGLAVALRISSLDIKRFMLFATVLVGFSSLASYWTGEPAEELIEHFPSVTKSRIDTHEEFAEKTTVVSVVTAVAAAIALLLQRRKQETLKFSLPIVFAFSLASSIMMAIAAHDGGLIRHPEINPNESSVPTEVD